MKKLNNKIKRKFGALVVIGMFVAISLSVTVNGHGLTQVTWDVGGNNFGGGTTQNFGTLSNDNIAIITNGNPVMRITAGGKVGIGSTSPGNKLTIQEDNSGGGPGNGQLRIQGNTETNKYLHLRLETDNDYGEIQVGEVGAPPRTYPLLLNPEGGNVGVGGGSSAPGAGLDVRPVVQSTDNFISLRSDFTFAPPSALTMDKWYGVYVETPTILMGSITTKYALVTEAGAGNVGIGTTAPSGILHVDGGTATTGSGTDITLIAQNAASGSNGNGGDLILKPGSKDGTGGDGNVGIGETNPGGKLDVDGSLLVGNEGIYDRDDSEVNIKENLIVETGTITGANTESIALGSTNDIITFTSGGSERMRIHSDGYIGIGGGIIPTSELHIGGETPKVTIGDADAEDTSILFDGNAWDFYIGLIDEQDELVLGSGSTIGNGKVIVIDTSSRVGIGDDDGLTYQLEVNGEAEFDGYLRAKDSSGIGFMDDESRKGFYIDGGGDIEIGHSAANIDVYGSLFVGNEGISDRVDSEVNIKENLIVETGVITGASSEKIDLGSTANVIAFTSGGSERMRIHSDGDIGIATGTQAPKARLEILATSGDQLRLTHTYDTDYATLTVNGNGRLIIETKGSGTDQDIELRTENFNDAISIDDSEKKVGIGTYAPKATLDVNGGLATQIIAVSSATWTVDEGSIDDCTIIAKSDNNQIDITLPSADDSKGRIIIVKRMGSNDVWIHAASGDYIDGDAIKKKLGTTADAHIYQCLDDTNWYILADDD
jgi:hypothetical protein